MAKPKKKSSAAQDKAFIAAIQSIIRNPSAWSLLLANILTMAFAYLERWSLIEIVFTYWCQSLIIGIFAVRRIRSLDRFSTTNYKIEGKQADATALTKNYAAIQFTLSYFIYHLVLPIFIIGFLPTRAGETTLVGFIRSIWRIMPGIAIFAANHLFSYWYNLKNDKANVPEIESVILTPFLRVIPMHLIIFVGGVLGVVLGLIGKFVDLFAYMAGTAAYSGLILLIFMIMKTVVDLFTHYLQHRDSENNHELYLKLFSILGKSRD